MLAHSRFITFLPILDELSSVQSLSCVQLFVGLIFLKCIVLIANMINIGRYNRHKQKLYWVLKKF